MARNRACVLLEMRLIRQREIWEEVREDRGEDIDRWAGLTDGEERLEEVYLRLELTGGAERMKMEEHGIRICRTIRRNHRAAAGMDTAMHSSHLSCMDRRREQRQAELL